MLPSALPKLEQDRMHSAEPDLALTGGPGVARRPQGPPCKDKRLLSLLGALTAAPWLSEPPFDHLAAPACADCCVT